MEPKPWQVSLRGSPNEMSPVSPKTRATAAAVAASTPAKSSKATDPMYNVLPRLLGNLEGEPAQHRTSVPQAPSEGAPISRQEPGLRRAPAMLCLSEAESTVRQVPSPYGGRAPLTPPPRRLSAAGLRERSQEDSNLPLWLQRAARHSMTSSTSGCGDGCHTPGLPVPPWQPRASRESSLESARCTGPGTRPHVFAHSNTDSVLPCGGASLGQWPSTGPAEKPRRVQRRAAAAAVLLLSGENWTDRCRGAVELAATGRAAVPYSGAVAAALADWHPKVRVSAARALRAMGEAVVAQHVRALANALLRDTHREVRRAAEEALRGIPESGTSWSEAPSIYSPSHDAPSDFARLSLWLGAGSGAPTGAGSTADVAAATGADADSGAGRADACTDTGLDQLIKGTPWDSGTSESSVFEEEAEEDGQEQPQCWGIQLRQLVDFREEIMDAGSTDNVQAYCSCHKLIFEAGCAVHVCLSDPCPYGDHRGVAHTPLAAAAHKQLQTMLPNMHAVVAREVKPRTLPYGCSFARMKNPDGLRITTFVTHTWEEPFDHFVGTLQMALRPEEVVWVCSFALDQNADIKKLLDTDDLLRSPFAKALRHAPKLIVCLDEQMKVPERSWCAFELEKASQWAIPTFIWPYHLTCLTDLEERIERLDIRRATASDSMDQERIHRAIQEGVGYEAMNLRLRAFLGDRLRFYQAAVRKHVQDFADLERQMVVARTEKDEATLAALEAERRERGRLLQAEMELEAHGQDDLEREERRQREEEWSQQQESEEHRRRLSAERRASEAEEDGERIKREMEAAKAQRDQAIGTLLETQREMQELVDQLQRANCGREEVRREREWLRQELAARTAVPPHSLSPATSMAALQGAWTTPPQSPAPGASWPEVALSCTSPPPVLRSCMALCLPASPNGAALVAVRAATSPSPPPAPVLRGGGSGHVVGIQHAVQRMGQAYKIHSFVTITPY